MTSQNFDVSDKSADYVTAKKMMLLHENDINQAICAEITQNFDFVGILYQ